MDQLSHVLTRALVLILFYRNNVVRCENNHQRFHEFFGICADKTNDTIPNQETLFFSCSLQAMYLVTSAAIPDQEKFIRVLKNLTLKDNHKGPVKDLGEHSMQKIREWFDIHEKSFNDGGYLKYNRPMTYQVNYHNDTASKMTGKYLYDWLEKHSGGGTQRLSVFKNENQFPIHKDQHGTELKQDQFFTNVLDSISMRKDVNVSITKDNIKHYWNLCRFSSASYNKADPICKNFTPKDATHLSLYEDQKFYNMNYTVSKLRAKKILSNMKMKLMEGFGNGVTYINSRTSIPLYGTF